MQMVALGPVDALTQLMRAPMLGLWFCWHKGSSTMDCTGGALGFAATAAVLGTLTQLGLRGGLTPKSAVRRLTGPIVPPCRVGIIASRPCIRTAGRQFLSAEANHSTWRNRRVLPRCGDPGAAATMTSLPRRDRHQARTPSNRRPRASSHGHRWQPTRFSRRPHGLASVDLQGGAEQFLRTQPRPESPLAKLLEVDPRAVEAALRIRANRDAARSPLKIDAAAEDGEDLVALSEALEPWQETNLIAAP